eukprot:TRINITY_DN16635_c0_g1_i1.p1 TRINITY_DN16635_c0_g1~~TRINITY_DN16635_c0_g1_i1.p1  ORF type:complete len:839 (+),score=188.84 TRINITY_DN16635_c0_g1_i1:54-2519(+)
MSLTPRGMTVTPRHHPQRKSSSVGRRGTRHLSSTPGPGEYNQDHNTIYKDTVEGWRRPHIYGRGISRGTMTEHRAFEDEVEYLQNKIEVLVQAGADYRQMVDELFTTTKNEAGQKDADMKQQLESLELELMNSRKETATANEHIELLTKDINTLTTDLTDMKVRVDEATDAKKRVEDELENFALRHIECEHQREADQRMTHKAEGDIANLQNQLRHQQQMCKELEATVTTLQKNVHQTSSAVAEKAILENEVSTLQQLITALQERNSSLEAETAAAKKRADDLPTNEEFAASQKTEQSLKERIKKLEASKRVLHWDVDRKKKIITEHEQTVSELQRKVADLFSDKIITSRKECNDGCCQTDPEMSVIDHRKLQQDYALLWQQLQEERARDSVISQLCEELNDELQKLTVENNTLREGLSNIESTFGKLLPKDDSSQESYLPGEIARLPQNPILGTTKNLIHSRDSMTQTNDVIEGEAVSSSQQPAAIQSAVSDLQNKYELEIQILKQKFKESAMNVLSTSRDHPGENLYRKVLAELRASERERETAQLLSAELGDENDDLREQLRRLLTADPVTKTVQGLLSSSIRTAEKRINEVLTKFKNTIRNRSVMIQKVHKAFESVEALSTCFGSHLANGGEIVTLSKTPEDAGQQTAAFISKCSELLETALSHHKIILKECITPWEKTALGLVDTTVHPQGDIVAHLRTTEDMLNLLWVTFVVPRIPRRDAQTYAPAFIQDVPFTTSLSPPTVHIGHQPPGPLSPPRKPREEDSASRIGSNRRQYSREDGRDRSAKFSFAVHQRPSSRVDPTQGMAPLLFNPDEPS